MKLLITGIHGFVGNNLVEYLKEGNEIFGLDIVSPVREAVVQTFGWDELDLIPKIDVVIHLAGKAHDTRSKQDEDVYFRVNTDLTKKIYDWFLIADANQFIFFSSVKAAAESVVGDFLTEDVEPLPVGPYGESKLAAEQYIFNNLPGESTNKNVIVLRPSMIHGPGNKGNLNLLYKVVSKGIPWPLGAFENRRSFTSIDNLKFLIEKIIVLRPESGVYNVADDDSLSTNELIVAISEASAVKNHIWKINKKYIKCFAYAGSLLNLPLNKDSLRKLTENYVVSNQKLKKSLGVSSLPLSAREGIHKTIKSFYL